MNVLIVGGGVVGLSIAADLAQRGVKVTLLEQSTPGAEASSAAAGMLSPQLEHTDFNSLFQLCLTSRTMYRAWIEALEDKSGIQANYVESGSLAVAFTEADAEKLNEHVTQQHALGLRAEFIQGKDLKQLEANISEKALAGAHHPDDHQVDPIQLLHALVIAMQHSGVELRTRTTVRGLIQEGERVTGVELDSERLTADSVVLTTGAWSNLLPTARLNADVIKPARGQMVGLQLPQSPARCYFKSADGYVVPRPDGRIIAGTTMELVGYDKSVTAQGIMNILQAATKLLPNLSNATVFSTWAGLRPWSQDGLPILGESVVPGLMLATGHFRNGILLAPITARILGQLIVKENQAIDLRPFHSNRYMDWERSH